MATWTGVNPVLGMGEIAFVTDIRFFVIGNGVDTFNDLLFDNTNIYTTYEDLVNAISTVIPKTDIVDSLISTDDTKVLSAKQGKALKDLIDAMRDKTLATLGTPYTVTGTTNEIVAFNHKISGTTLGNNSKLDFPLIFKGNTGSGAKTMRAYMNTVGFAQGDTYNTSGTLKIVELGSTGTNTGITQAFQVWQNSANQHTGTTINFAVNGNFGVSTLGSTFNVANDIYIQVTIQNAVSGDSTTLHVARIEHLYLP